jgi:hypothetical protein
MEIDDPALANCLKERQLPEFMWCKREKHPPRIAGFENKDIELPIRTKDRIDSPEPKTLRSLILARDPRFDWLRIENDEPITI